MIEFIIGGAIIGYVARKIYSDDRIRFNISNGCWMSKEEWDNA